MKSSIQKSALWAVCLVAGGMCVSVKAQTVNQQALIQKLVQCQATPKEVAMFSGLIDAQKIKLKEDKKSSPWGGLAWTVSTPISVGGARSKTVVMHDRFNFHILVKSATPQADMEKMAKALGLPKVLDYSGYFDYSRSNIDNTEADGRKSVRVFSAEDVKADYYAGCAYDPDLVKKERKAQ